MARLILAACLDLMDRPWQWGVADCCTAACDVFARLHGIDPMAPLRGRYSTRLGAGRLIARHGGWQAMGDALAARSGLVVMEEGRPGDLGLIDAGGGTLALGICTAPGVWAGKSESGMATVYGARRAWGAL